MNFRMNSTDTGAGTYSVFGSTDSTLILSLGGMYTLVEFIELTVRITPAFFQSSITNAYGRYQSAFCSNLTFAPSGKLDQFSFV